MGFGVLNSNEKLRCSHLGYNIM